MQKKIDCQVCVSKTSGPLFFFAGLSRGSGVGASTAAEPLEEATFPQS